LPFLKGVFFFSFFFMLQLEATGVWIPGKLVFNGAASVG